MDDRLGSALGDGAGAAAWVGAGGGLAGGGGGARGAARPEAPRDDGARRESHRGEELQGESSPIQVREISTQGPLPGTGRLRDPRQPGLEQRRLPDGGGRRPGRRAPADREPEAREPRYPMGGGVSGQDTLCGDKAHPPVRVLIDTDGERGRAHGLPRELDVLVAVEPRQGQGRGGEFPELESAGAADLGAGCSLLQVPETHAIP